MEQCWPVFVSEQFGCPLPNVVRPTSVPLEWAAVLRDQFSSNFNCSRYHKLSRLARYFKSVDISTHEKVKAVLFSVLPSPEGAFLYMKGALGFSSSSF